MRSVFLPELMPLQHTKHQDQPHRTESKDRIPQPTMKGFIKQGLQSPLEEHPTEKELREIKKGRNQ